MDPEVVCEKFTELGGYLGAPTLLFGKRDDKVELITNAISCLLAEMAISMGNRQVRQLEEFPQSVGWEGYIHNWAMWDPRIAGLLVSLAGVSCLIFLLLYLACLSLTISHAVSVVTGVQRR